MRAADEDPERFGDLAELMNTQSPSTVSDKLNFRKLKRHEPGSVNVEAATKKALIYLDGIIVTLECLDLSARGCSEIRKRAGQLRKLTRGRNGE